jgi:uncharacterized oxidoreductase
MNISNNTILITGGATGIGFALAESLIEAGNKIIICGRREDRLKEAKARLPAIYTRVCDVSKETERKALFSWVKSEFPKLNILVNNAGVQKMVDLTKGTADLKGRENEISTNLEGPIYLAAHFIPLLTLRSRAAIINISSGLGFIPIAAMLIYCATKAAIHSFTVSLRYQLKDTSIKVFEIIPPMVDTELGGSAMQQMPEGERGIKPAELAKEVMQSLSMDKYEIPVGESKAQVNATKRELERLFQNMNRW